MSGFDGATARPMRPRSTVGSPALSFVQLAPPSVERYRALSGPPSMSVQTCRRRWYAAAISTSGLRGSSTTSVTPVFSLMDSTHFQVLPPSVVLYRPRSPPGPHSGPCAATYTTSELRGSRRILPMCSDLSSPTFFQDLPPSSERYTPSP